MKALKTSTIMAAASVLFIVASAHAMSGSHGHSAGGWGTSTSGSTTGKQAVMDKFGGVIHTASGDCVITKWDAKGGSCVGSELRTIYFNFNSSALTPAAKTKLDVLAKSLKSSNVSAVKIVGFADEIGTPSYNLRLSQKRANAAAAYLRGKGVKVMGKSEVRGLGETASKSECSTTKGKAQQACLWRDRRVEVEVVN
jgi:OmpA-OmpF porin, OOP family